jgi:predicted metal-dependent hydrolase
LHSFIPTSKRFYAFPKTLMPDWQERKSILDHNAVFWL